MKFSGIVLLLAIAVSGYFSWDKANEKPYVANNTGSSVQQMQELKRTVSVGEQDLTTAEKINKQIQLVSAYKVTTNSPTTLVALKPDAPAIQLPTASNVKQRFSPYASKPIRKYYKPYAVSMIFISPNNRYAVIDNQFSKVGDVLSDGGKVTEIEESYVKVMRGKKVQTFKIATKIS